MKYDFDKSEDYLIIYFNKMLASGLGWSRTR